MATDPICGMVVRESPEALQADRDGRRYYFCSTSCRTAFAQPQRDHRRLVIATAFSLAVGAVILALMYAPPSRWEAAGAHDWMWDREVASLILAAAVQFGPGLRFYRGVVDALRARAANMDTLVALGTTAAFLGSALVTLAPGRFDGATFLDASVLVIAFILLGRTLEDRMKQRASRALTSLMALRPATARRVEGENVVEVAIDDVALGDSLEVRPGERVPTDGVVTEGAAAVDESLLSGESMPVERGVGSDVVGGSVDTNGRLIIRATRVGRDTTIAQIADMVERAQTGHAPIQRLVDTVSSYFVPIVIAVAALTWIGWWTLGERGPLDALLPAIAVLVVACPCALGLATPVALVVAVGRGAEAGILVKDPESLQVLSRATTIVFDKTGTLTRGRPGLTDVIPIAAPSEMEVLKVAASAEAPSTHPLAVAVVGGARARGTEPSAVSDFNENSGRGVKAILDAQRVLVGTPAWMSEHGLNEARLADERGRLQRAGKTVLMVAKGAEVWGLIALQDEAKDGARAAVREVAARGLDVALVTGDNESTAAAIAGQLGITRVHAGVAPKGKASLVESLRASGRVVVMVGDGINDGPALAAADVGIALGSGTDLARETGSILLLKDDPRDVANAHELARATFRIVRQNLAWAFLYNVALIPLAALGVLPPVAAGAAMALSSISVVANSLRLRALRLPFVTEATPRRIRPAIASPPKLRMAPRLATVRGMIDPVCGMTVDPENARFTAMVGGKALYFCSAGCKTRFLKDPDGFATPKGMA